MSQALLKRRLIIGTLFCVLAVALVVNLTNDADITGMLIPALFAGVLSSLVVAWFFVRSDRRRANRSQAKVSIGVVLGGASVGSALGRTPDGVFLVILVLCLGFCLGMTLSAAYELWRGTYAKEPASQKLAE